MTSRKYAYPNGQNGMMELAYEAVSFSAVDTEF
jgi:hypothetical protein